MSHRSHPGSSTTYQRMVMVTGAPSFVDRPNSRVVAFRILPRISDPTGLLRLCRVSKTRNDFVGVIAEIGTVMTPFAVLVV